MPANVHRLCRAPIGPLVACVLAFSPGCGTADRPPQFGDSFPETARGSNPSVPSFNLGGSPNVPMCTLGPEGGVCACSDESLAGDTPNIYFVLDRSGSMNALNKWANVQSALDSLIIALGPRARMGAAVFPNPNEDGCAPGIEVFAPRRGDPPAGTPGPTETALFTVLRRIPAAGGTPTAATLAALLPKLQSLPGKTYVILATDGGPNCNQNANCTVDQCTDNIESILGCPRGGPPNCCADPNNGPFACLDAQPAVAAVQAIATAGIPVYVVGVPGSGPYADLLDQMAVAGGTARGTEPQYYAIGTSDQAALYAVLSSIAAKITGTCTLTLDNPPPSTALVNVFFDERAVPQAGPDGWTLDGTTVTISGSSCQKILDGAVLDVRVVAGCPTVTF